MPQENATGEWKRRATPSKTTTTSSNHRHSSSTHSSSKTHHSKSKHVSKSHSSRSHDDGKTKGKDIAVPELTESLQQTSLDEVNRWDERLQNPTKFISSKTQGEFEKSNKSMSFQCLHFESNCSCFTDYKLQHSREFKNFRVRRIASLAMIVPDTDSTQMFKILWSEPQGSAPAGGSNSVISVVAHKTKHGTVFEKVRRFLIVDGRKGHCICL